jgi:hypothetical protein
MTQPSKKHESLDRTLEAMSSILFGVSRKESIYANKCLSCKEDATEFKDNVSRKEFTISGLCQPCQDSVFGG